MMWFRAGCFLASATLVSTSVEASDQQVTLGLNFTGSSFFEQNTFIPPDTMGAVGPRHIVELINGRYRIYNKKSGRSLREISLNSFWGEAGVDVERFAFDPRVLYDPETRRWYATSVDNSGLPNSILLAVSCSSNPLNGWVGFAVDSDSTDQRWADFPELGFNADGVFVSANMFAVGEEGDTLVTIISVPKDELINTNSSPIVSGSAVSAASLVAKAAAAPEDAGDATDNGVTTNRDPLPIVRVPRPMSKVNGGAAGQPLSATRTRNTCAEGESATVTIFENLDPNETGFNPQPVVDQSPSGGAAALLSDFNTPAGVFKRSLIEEPGFFPVLNTDDGFIAVEPFNPPPDARQPGPKQDLNTGDERLSSNVVFQLGSYWGVQGVDSDGRAAMRWFEIDAETLAVLQEGVISDRERDFYFGSIAVNEFGDVVIGFSASSSREFVSAYAVAGSTRADGTQFSDPILLKRGNADYELLDGIDRNRWGDYSATVVDPKDPYTFWTFQEFVLSEDRWAIQITEIRFPIGTE